MIKYLLYFWIICLYAAQDAPHQQYRHAATYIELHTVTVRCQNVQDAGRYEEYIRSTFINPQAIDQEIAYLEKYQRETRIEELEDYTRPFAVSFSLRAINALKKYKEERT